MKVAVTGASGHVGNCLCRELINRGVAVRALVHNNEDDLVEMGAEIVRGDILDPEAVLTLCRDTDVVYHLAAKISIDKKDKDLVYKTNVHGTQNVIDACLELSAKRLIHFSTIHTFGTHNSDDVLDETSPPISHSTILYEDSKAEAERRVLAAVSKGLNALVLNPTAIIGPYDYQPSYLGQALIKMYQNKLPMLVQGGYDFIDVRDVVDAAVNAADKGNPGNQYILSGQWLSLKDLALKIEQVTGNRTPKMVAPPFVAHIGLPFIRLWSAITGTHPLYTAESLEILKYSSNKISNAKAREVLGLNPRPIEASLSDIFDWFQQQQMV